MEVPDGDAGIGAVANAGLLMVLLRRRLSAKVSLFSNSSADIVRSSERYDQRCDVPSALVPVVCACCVCIARCMTEQVQGRTISDHRPQSSGLYGPRLRDTGMLSKRVIKARTDSFMSGVTV